MPTTKTEPPELIEFFGVDPDTGALLRPPKTWDEVRECVRVSFNLPSPKERRRAKAQEERKHRGHPPPHVDPRDLCQTGWGLVFAPDVDEDVKKALGPLVEHRRRQAGSLCRVFQDDDEVLSAGVSAADWLCHVGSGPGVPDFGQVPYYLMIVGDPKSLPFGVDFDLNSACHAVGRLTFPRAEDYARYARSVIAAEEARPERRYVLGVVGMEHPNDVTRSSMKHLVRPLLGHFEEKGVAVDVLLGENATRDRVLERLGGPATPSILFYAGHGLGPGKDAKHLERLGGLLCAPYAGKVRPDMRLTGSDIEDDADLRGLVAVLFGCFTVGMPAVDSFCHKPPRPLGPASMSALASRMLSHERGALAVLGHVDRAWSYSYYWKRMPKEGRSQPHAFIAVADSLLAGIPLGASAASLSDRYAAMLVNFHDHLERLRQDEDVDLDSFALARMAERDARSYLVFGDPAVRALR